MNEFSLYFTLGLKHIADWNAYDHILFVSALCLSFSFQEWRRLLILVTAFTLGHSITLALSALKIVVVDSGWVEFLIPITIVITAFMNIFAREESSKPASLIFRYASTAFFGLIHGLGFSFYFSELLGKEASMIQPLFAFNLGIEAGQILIVTLVFLGVELLLKVLPVKHITLKKVLSGIIALMAFLLIRFP